MGKEHARSYWIRTWNYNTKSKRSNLTLLSLLSCPIILLWFIKLWCTLHIYPLWVLKNSRGSVSHNSTMMFCPFYTHMSYVMVSISTVHIIRSQIWMNPKQNFAKNFYSQPLTTPNSSTSPSFTPFETHTEYLQGPLCIWVLYLLTHSPLKPEVRMELIEEH